jgi:large subunit ribosomal protein L6e
MWFNNAQCNSLGTPGKHNLCKWCIRASNKLLLVALRGTIKRGQGKKKSYHHQFDSANPKCKRFLFNQIQKATLLPRISTPFKRFLISFLSTRRPTKTTNKKLTLLISSSSPSSLLSCFYFSTNRMPKANQKQISRLRAKAKSSGFYPADDQTVAKVRNMTPTTAKLRSSLTCGTVCILLAGRHRGKRVVFLKQLPSGLLLVTGPYKINGCPCRRVDQTYVIATSTKIDAAAAAAAASDLDNESAWFKRSDSSKDDEAEFLNAGKTPERVINADFKAIQKKVDAALMPAIKAVKDLRSYLNAKFSLSKGDRPHEMVF